MATPTQRKLSTDNGTMTFQPSAISWSKRNLGRVQRTQTKNQRKKATLVAKMASEAMAPSQPVDAVGLHFRR